MTMLDTSHGNVLYTTIRPSKIYSSDRYYRISVREVGSPESTFEIDQYASQCSSPSQNWSIFQPLTKLINIPAPLKIDQYSSPSQNWSIFQPLSKLINIPAPLKIDQYSSPSQNWSIFQPLSKIDQYSSPSQNWSIFQPLSKLINIPAPLKIDQYSSPFSKLTNISAPLPCEVLVKRRNSCLKCRHWDCVEYYCSVIIIIIRN